MRSVKRSQIIILKIPHICHRHHRRCLWRKICHVEKISPQDRLSCGEIFHMTNRQLEKCLHMVDMEKYGEKSVMWRYFFTWEMWRQICFVTILAVLSWNLFYCHIYAVLLRQIFCRDLRAFVWRKMDKYQVWQWQVQRHSENALKEQSWSIVTYETFYRSHVFSWPDQRCLGFDEIVFRLGDKL